MRAPWGAALGLLALGCATSPASERGDLAGYFDCLRESGSGIVSAHRGGPAPGSAENAIETFEETLARDGFVALEVDVRRTGDGQLVLMHDETLERTTTGAGPVADTPLAVIQSLGLEDNDGRAAPGAPPSLDEALAWAIERGAILQLDMKRGVAFADVVRAVESAGAENRVVVIVYSLTDAIAVARLNPRLMLSVSIRAAGDLDTLALGGVDLERVLAWTGTTVPDPALFAALRTRSVEVIFGTLGRPGERLDDRFADPAESYRALVGQGVTMIATDRPDIAAPALRSHTPDARCSPP